MKLVSVAALIMITVPAEVFPKEGSTDSEASCSSSDECQVEEQEGSEVAALNVELLQRRGPRNKASVQAKRKRSNVQAHRAIDGVPECFDVPSFRYHTVNGTRGQCLPSVSPGAFTTKPQIAPGQGCYGLVDVWNPGWGTDPTERCEQWYNNSTWGIGKQPTNCFTGWPWKECPATCCKHFGRMVSSEQWACWNPDTVASVRTEAEAKAQGFEGICTFADFAKNVQPDDVPECHHIPFDCSPGHSKYWGACYSNETEQWDCIAQPSTVPAESKDVAEKFIQNAAKGDCKAIPRRDRPDEDLFYQGVCRFVHTERKFFKCDTVKTYQSTNAETCSGSFNSACFSLKTGVIWQCFPDSLDNPSCVLTATPAGGHYDGSCYFPQAGANYTNASSAADL
jgi:hypothetical protein